MTQFTQLKQAPYRYDHVGSFLRPQELLEARDLFEKNKLSREELTVIEDKTIIELIKKQEEIGLKTITDGEFRRTSWHFDFFWGLNGVERTETEVGTQFEGSQVFALTSRITDKITGENHPFIQHFLFTQIHASKDSEVKLTIPAPSQFIQEVLRDFNIDYTKSVYSTRNELVQDIAKAYGTFLNEIYMAGCRTIQFDDCTWGRLAGGKNYDGSSYTLEELADLKELYVSLNNLAISKKPDGLRINTHICRGNFRSTWFASGGYDTVATPLFDTENVYAYHLEYDSDRAGDFKPLKDVSEDKMVVLGLVTTKDGQLENKEDLINRVKEASQYIDLDKICISPQCGFSSNSVGNTLTEEEQWNKILLIKEVAEEIWGTNI